MYALLTLQIVLYAGFPFYFARQLPPNRAVSFLIYLAVLLILGGFVGSVYSIPLTESITISGGNILYGAFMMTAVLFVIVEKDLTVLRHVIRMLIVVNIAQVLFFSTISWALKLPETLNPFGTSASVFSVSIAFLILGGALIIAELLTLIFVFEQIKKRISNPPLISALYILSFAVVLCLDGILFPAIAFAFNPELVDIIIGGLPGKVTIAIAYSLLMLLFVMVNRNGFSEFIKQPMPLKEVLFAPREKLIQTIQTQQLSLSKSEDRFKHLAESIDDIFISVDENMRYTYWNAASESMGYTENEAIGQTMYDLFPNRKNSELDQFYQRVLKSGTSAGFIEHTQINGKDRYFSITAYPYGKGLSVIARDITEREELESTLRQMQKMESIGQLAGGIAHDLNNILVPITLSAELGLMSTEKDDKRYPYFRDTLTAADQASRLIQQILAFSRKQILEFTIINMADVLQRYENMIERILGADIKPVLVIKETGCTVNADNIQMEQLLLNLIVNAKDAMPYGGTLTISVEKRSLNASIPNDIDESIPVGDYVLLQVEDNGIGMDPQTRSQILEPFFTTKSASEGTGLGLSTVYGIIKQHKGYLLVTSVMGKGSVFECYLPQVVPGEQTSPREEKIVRTPAIEI